MTDIGIADKQVSIGRSSFVGGSNSGGDGSGSIIGGSGDNYCGNR